MIVLCYSSPLSAKPKRSEKQYEAAWHFCGTPGYGFAGAKQVSRSGAVDGGEPGRDRGGSQVLASQAGATILDRGGSAIDAAIAANAVLGVTEPMMNGVGGDLLAIIWDAKAKKLYGLNSSGMVSERFEHSRAEGERALTGPRRTAFILSLCRARWRAGKRCKRSSASSLCRRLLAPAIYYADQGVPIAERIAVAWDSNGKRLLDVPDFKATFMPGGHAPVAGQIFQNKDSRKRCG